MKNGTWSNLPKVNVAESSLILKAVRFLSLMMSISSLSLALLREPYKLPRITDNDANKGIKSK